MTVRKIEPTALIEVKSVEVTKDGNVQVNFPVPEGKQVVLASGYLRMKALMKMAKDGSIKPGIHRFDPPFHVTLEDKK